MNILYELLLQIARKDKKKLSTDEKSLINLSAGFNDSLYGRFHNYQELVKEGSREFEFVKNQIPLGIQPSYVQTHEGIIYKIILSKKGGILVTKTSLEIELQNNRELMKRHDVNPELIGLYTKRVFRDMMENFIDNGQFKSERS